VHLHLIEINGMAKAQTKKSVVKKTATKKAPAKKAKKPAQSKATGAKKKTAANLLVGGCFLYVRHPPINPAPSILHI